MRAWLAGANYEPAAAAVEALQGWPADLLLESCYIVKVADRPTSLALSLDDREVSVSGTINGVTVAPVVQRFATRVDARGCYLKLIVRFARADHLLEGDAVIARQVFEAELRRARSLAAAENTLRIDPRVPAPIQSPIVINEPVRVPEPSPPRAEPEFKPGYRKLL